MERTLVTEPALGPIGPEPARDARTMCEAFQATAAARAEQVALRTLRDGVSITFAEYAERVRKLCGALHALGVRSGDTVACMLTNRPEFHLIDTAAMHLGATPFSVYNTSSPEQIAYLLRDAGNRVLVFEAGFRDRVRGAVAEVGEIDVLVALDGAQEGEIAFEDLLEAEAGLDFDFEAAWQMVEPDDVVTLIYTSGTTGPPKGVQLTHAGILAECRGLDAAAPWLGAGGHTISYLPVAHIADRGLAHYGQMFWGDTITCCPDVTQVFAHVADARPTRFGAVPRVWEKLQATLEAGFQGDLAAAARADPGIGAGIRARLGFDRCRSYLIGAAPAPLHLFEFFAALGIPICEVWGMSELANVATIVPQDQLRFGTVGKALPGIELRLEEDGELLVRSPTVMAGYRNQPEKTAETIDSDGWLHTGDVAEIDDDGFVRIVDRKKELIINAGGKNMSPANIEQQLKMGSPLIGQAMAVGDGRPYNVALIVLDPDACAAFAAEHGLADASVAAMALEPTVLAEVAAGVERANSHLSRVEQIKRHTVLATDWPPAGDELTPTMKLKRKPIAAKYADEIEALYTRG
jgi:long-subunit acyl-CoA synthetase (AMP-forming)